MELRSLRRSRQVEELIKKNFGEDDDLWNPKCFDMALGLWEGRKLLGMCTLQWAPGGYWILGDLCTVDHGRGYATELVRQACLVLNSDVWADATCPASERALKKHGFEPTAIKPWKPCGKGLYRVYTP